MEAEDHDLAGQGSFKLEGSWLKLRQFHGLIVKRFHCAKRNTKALFSQILLPAFFVCVAMTVALSVPEIGTCEPLSWWVWEDTGVCPIPFPGPRLMPQPQAGCSPPSALAAAWRESMRPTPLPPQQLGLTDLPSPACPVWPAVMLRGKRRDEAKA